MGLALILGAALGIRRIISPAMSTAAITSLIPKENDAPVLVYT